MPQRLLNYTSMDYDKIRTQIENILENDSRFENFRDSSIAKTILDLLAAGTDLNNFYIERTAEESFLDTARLKSSVITLAKMLGYVPRRPSPSTSSLSIVLSGPLPAGLIAGEKIDFVKYTTNLTDSDGTPYILKNTYQYSLTQNDIDGGTGNPNWTKTINYGVITDGTADTITLDEAGNIPEEDLVTVDILQGEFKTEAILGSTNPKIGQVFQRYKISDTSFSNYYGDEDLGWDSDLETMTNTANITQIGIGVSEESAFSSENLFTIDRRTIIKPSYTSGSDVPKVALVRTTKDEMVEVIFGEDRFAQIGARTIQDNIYVKYLSVVGSKSNKVGVIGNELKTSQTFLTDNNVDVTNNIKFYFFKNVINGSDMESTDSIRYGAPEIYYSLDRVVTKRDYVSFLKTLTNNGKEIKNAYAWGEQEEVQKEGDRANFRYFNCAFFSVLSSLYNLPTNGIYSALSLDNLYEAYLETSADFGDRLTQLSADGYPEQSYFNIFIAESPRDEVQRVRDYRVVNSGTPIDLVYKKLNDRTQTTIRNIYVSPSVQTFTLEGNVRIGRLEDRISVQNKINNAIYSYLNDKADFNVEIHRSNIQDIVLSYPEVINCNLYFKPETYSNMLTSWSSDPDIVSLGSLSADVVSVYDNNISQFIISAGDANIINSPYNLSISAEDSIYLSGGPDSIWGYGNWTTYDYKEYKVGSSVEVSERNFYRKLMKNIYTDLKNHSNATIRDWRNSQGFKNVMFRLHNDLLGSIRSNMIDVEGNITNYSFGHEIAQVRINLNYQFLPTNSRV